MYENEERDDKYVGPRAEEDEQADLLGGAEP